MSKPKLAIGLVGAGAIGRRPGAVGRRPGAMGRQQAEVIAASDVAAPVAEAARAGQTARVEARPC